MSYDLTIQFDDAASQTARIASIKGLLNSHPGIRRVTSRGWILEPKPTVHAEIDLEADDSGHSEVFSSVSLHIPYPFLRATHEPALRLSISIAEHLGWRVFDEQSGDYIDEIDVSDVLDGEGRLEESISNWTYAATHQSLFFLVIAVGLSAIGAVAIVARLEVQPDKVPTYLFWIGLPIGLAIFTIKIVFDRWLECRRSSHLGS